MSQKKQIFKLSLLKKLVADENSCVSLVQSTRLLALPPIFLNDMKSGIFYLLNSLLKKYDRSLGGIVIGYQNIKVLMDENTGIIPMGAPETEVNVSVEFYIFQPKIGSYLEGVINKKSNTHIGCLVHQYFNATILKPEDVYYEDWICKDLNVDDKILFKVKDLDFTTLLPYIEGIYDGRIVLSQTHTQTNMNCDTDNLIAVIKSHCSKESVLSEFSNDKTIVDKDKNDCISSKQNNNQIEEEVDASNISKNNEFEEDESLNLFLEVKTKKKKKKKKREKVELSAISNVNVCFKENSLNDKEVMSSKNNVNLLSAETPKKEKRSGKKKDEDANENLTENKKKKLPINLPWNIYNKPIEVEDENSNDFVKTSKSKKDRKKKKNESEISHNSNKSSECLPVQETDDNVLCSTQLGTALAPNKLRISFCSPIPQTITSEVKADNKNTTTKSLLNQEIGDLSKTEVKKKNKKRKREKREEESENSPATKKTKALNTFSSSKVEDTETKVNGDGEKFLVQSMMEELYKQQLNRVREELNMSSSDKESFKGERVKKKKADKKKSLNVPNKMTSQMNEENNSEVKSLLKRLLNEELQRVKEELGMSDKDSYSRNKRSEVETKKVERSFAKDQTREASFQKNEITNVQINGTKEPEKISDLENLTKNLIKRRLHLGPEESSKVKTNSGKEKKKRKLLTNKHEASKEKIQNSLYDKLLNEAKSLVTLDQNNATNVLQTRVPKEKKKDEFSNFSENYSKKKDSQKKNSEKKQELEETDNFKNGSMYDVTPTPEKRNPDKSLFSDSEQSHLSPVKKPKEMNGKPGKSMVQNLMDDFHKEEMKKLKGESDRENLKGGEKRLKKQKKTKKSRTQNTEVESLYEKLLREARSLVAIREESTSTKTKKNIK